MMVQLTLFPSSKAMGKQTLVKRPLLRYYGGGWQRAAWTVGYFPPHDVYCEPCFGAGSVLLHKPAAKREIANDVDGRVMNFHTVVRERPFELIEQIRLTPWHEGEYKKCLQTAVEPLEDARRFFFICWASVKGGSNPGSADFRWQKKADRRSLCIEDIRSLDHLLAASQRLAKVQFFFFFALKVIQRMYGTKGLIYFDPPYLPATRARKKEGYAYEVTAVWHEEAAALLCQHDGYVVVSGYESALYAELYEAYGWRRVERPARTNSGGTAVECLWLNPLTAAYWGI